MLKTNSLLDEIVSNKVKEIAKAKERLSLEELKSSLSQRQTPVRDFKAAISGSGSVKLIAEIKKASPSKGLIVNNFNHLKFASEFEATGRVSTISVITDFKYFKGKTSFVGDIKKVVSVPVFRKDFIFDEYQIYESYLAESDALLLIVSLLEEDKLCKLLELSHELGMQCLVETHNEKEVETAINAGADIVGVNARNLRSFAIDNDLFGRLAKKIPLHCVKVAESGLETFRDVERVHNFGANAILVGTSIMSADNKSTKIKELLKQ